MSEVNDSNSQDSFPLAEVGLFDDVFMDLGTLFQADFMGDSSSVQFRGLKPHHQPDFSKNTGDRFPTSSFAFRNRLVWTLRL